MLKKYFDHIILCFNLKNVAEAEVYNKDKLNLKQVWNAKRATYSIQYIKKRQYFYLLM